MGFYCWGCTFVTITNFTVGTTGSRGYENGHRGMWFEHGANNLVSYFNISSRMVHDVSVYNTEQSSVFVNGTGRVSRAWVMQGRVVIGPWY
jgi:hypothetical protein